MPCSAAPPASIDAEIFDPAFGKGGGEDYDLFCRLQRRGRRFVWLPEAAAREFVPASRCERAYLRRRFYAGGQAFAAAMARGGAPSPADALDHPRPGRRSGRFADAARVPPP